jgi:hypothetical protein
MSRSEKVSLECTNNDSSELVALHERNDQLQEFMQTTTALRNRLENEIKDMPLTR